MILRSCSLARPAAAPPSARLGRRARRGGPFTSALASKPAAARRVIRPHAAADSAPPKAAATQQQAPPSPPQTQQPQEQPQLQQQQQAEDGRVDWDYLRVSVNHVFTVENVCALHVRGTLSGREAQRAAVVAAALLNLRQREAALNAVVHTARVTLPGVLHPNMLSKFDRLRLAGRRDAGMVMLGFGQLHALCARVAPEECKQIEEEMVARAIELQSEQLEPPRKPRPPTPTAAGPPAPNPTSSGTADEGSTPPAATPGGSGSSSSSSGGGGGSLALGGIGSSGSQAGGAGTGSPAIGSPADSAPFSNSSSPAGSAPASNSGSGSLAGGRQGPGYTGPGHDFVQKKMPFRPPFDLPTQLAQLPEWTGWMRRMRTAVIRWQKQQAAAAAAIGEKQQAAAAAGETQTAAAAAAAAAGGGAEGPGGVSGTDSGGDAVAGRGGAAAPTKQAAAAEVQQAQQAQQAQLGVSSGVDLVLNRRKKEGLSGGVVTSFEAQAVTPDGLPMRVDLVVEVENPEGRQLVKAMDTVGFGTFCALCPPGMLGSELQGAAWAPEPTLGKLLEVAAFNSIRAPHPAQAQAGPTPYTFTCALTEAGADDRAEGTGTSGALPTSASSAGVAAAGAQAAAAASPAAAGGAGAGAGTDASSSGSSSGSSGSGSSGGGVFEFGGGEVELSVLIRILNLLTTGSVNPDVWAPSEQDWPIRMQRCSKPRRSGWPRLRAQAGTSGAGAANAPPEPPAYRLRVMPPQLKEVPVQQEGVVQAATPANTAGTAAAREVALTRRQLDALLDCLDCWMLHHPGYVTLKPLPPLEAPPSRWLRLQARLGGMLGGGGGGGGSTAV